MSKKKDIRKNFRDDVYKRDKYTCRHCGAIYSESTAKELLDAHHITDRSEMSNGGYVKENGITLCKYNAEGGEENSCHMKAEKFHITGGAEWEEGMHPDDLYNLIGSSYEEAVNASEKL